METRGIRMAVGGALTATLVLAVGLGTASAQRSDPCGATTPRSTCEKGGVLFGGIYQVHYELTSGASPTVTCAGGPSLDSRDSALYENFTDYLELAGIGVDEVTDSKGRLVGFSFQVGSLLSGATLRQHLSCIDDH